MNKELGIMHKKPVLRYFIVTVILYSLFFIPAPPVCAQQITLSITPPIVETVIKPGKSILVGYTVTNSGDPATMRFNIRTFSAQGTSGAMNIYDDIEGPIRFSLDNNDLQLDQPFLLRTGSRKQALVRMRVPEGTPDGDYYYILLAGTDSTPGINGSSGSISTASIGSPLLITVTQSGKIQIKGSIESIRIFPRYTITLFNKKYQIIDSSDAIPVYLTLANEGNNVFKPEGTISVKGGFGETITRSIIPQNVLADSKRTVNCSPDCVFSGFFVGGYNIKASIRLSEKQSSLTASTTFIGIPFKFVLGILVAIIVTIGFIVKGKKKHKTINPNTKP